MWYALMIGGGAVIFAVFLALYFYYRSTESTVLPKVFSALSVVGLVLLLIGAALLVRPYLTAVLPNGGDYILIGVIAVALLLAFWFLLRPAFSTNSKKKEEEVKKITATGTKTVSTGTAKKKKKKNNSMKAQMGTSKKRRLPRY